VIYVFTNTSSSGESFELRHPLMNAHYRTHKIDVMSLHIRCDSRILETLDQGLTDLCHLIKIFNR
jgi:hypothetical protein